MRYLVKSPIIMLSFLASLLLIWFLLSLVDLQQILIRIIGINPFIYIFTLFLYFLSLFVKSSRMICRFPDINYTDMLKVISINQLINRTFPLRTGELSLPLILKRTNNIPYSESTSTLILIRILDVLSLLISCFSFLIVMYLLRISLPFPNHFIFLLIIIFIPIFLFSKNLDFVFPKITKILNILSVGKFKLKFDEINKAVNSSILDLQSIYNRLLLYSIIDKFIHYIIAIILILGMGYEINIGTIVFACAFSAITEILPIFSIGNFGTFELGWSVVMIYYGVSSSSAISSGFEYHLLSLSFTIFFGLIGLYLVGYDLIFSKGKNEK